MGMCKKYGFAKQKMYVPEGDREGGMSEYRKKPVVIEAITSAYYQRPSLEQLKAALKAVEGE